MKRFHIQQVCFNSSEKEKLNSFGNSSRLYVPHIIIIIQNSVHCSFWKIFLIHTFQHSHHFKIIMHIRCNLLLRNHMNRKYKHQSVEHFIYLLSINWIHFNAPLQNYVNQNNWKPHYRDRFRVPNRYYQIIM